MQLLLPIYPVNTTLVNANVGVYERDGLVHYLVNGLPVYPHSRDDNASFRFITSNFINQGLCRNVDIERAFGVSEDSVSRALKKYGAKGAGWLLWPRRAPRQGLQDSGRMQGEDSVQARQMPKCLLDSQRRKRKGICDTLSNQTRAFKKKSTLIQTESLGTTLNQRNEVDQGAAFGIAASRVEERVACSLGQGGLPGIKFEESQALSCAGVLFLLPALLRGY